MATNPILPQLPDQGNQQHFTIRYALTVAQAAAASIRHGDSAPAMFDADKEINLNGRAS